MTGNNVNLVIAAIDGAEDIRDPLDGLTDKIAADPGAAFAPEVLRRLYELKIENRSTFEILRAQLKKAGCRVTALDAAIADETGEEVGHRRNQSDILIELVPHAGIFHAPDDTGYADLEINGHRETWPIRSKGFRRWLLRQFFDSTRRCSELRGFEIGTQRH